MNKILFYAFLGVFCHVASNVGAQNNRSASNNVQDMEIFYHTVERGQTVFSIAKMYDIMVIEIYKLNPGSENVIKTGERLKIPQRKYEEKSILNPSNDDFTLHTIRSGDTLSGLARRYGVSQDNILQANPNLSNSNFQAGKQIRIPKAVSKEASAEVVEKSGAKEVYYTVPQGDTEYSICRKFKTTEAELLKMNPELAGGLRAGMILRIPLRVNENELPKSSTPEATSAKTPMNAANRAKLAKGIRVALFLPVDTENAKMTELAKRHIEFYEGFLLAYDSLRNQGITIELFTYEIGERNITKTRQVLQEKSEELKKVHLIIGGYANEQSNLDQIKLIADFAKQHKINYVSPFTRNDAALNNEFVFQVHTPPAYLNENVANAGANLFAKHNIIFLDTQDKDDRDDPAFLKTFKKELNERNISYREATYKAENFESQILSLLSNTKPNMIMPVSQSIDALKKTNNTLRMIADSKPEYQISLFGYPVWQTYTQECLDDFHALNTFIYCYYYSDNIHPSVKAFYDKYKYWYNKSPMLYLPKLALVGYDTGMFFISAIHKFGANFDTHLSDIHYKSLQNGFNFQRINETGGFINANIFIIHYSKDFTITRSEFK